MLWGVLQSARKRSRKTFPACASARGRKVGNARNIPWKSSSDRQNSALSKGSCRALQSRSEGRVRVGGVVQEGAAYIGGHGGDEGSGGQRVQATASGRSLYHPRIPVVFGTSSYLQCWTVASMSTLLMCRQPASCTGTSLQESGYASAHTCPKTAWHATTTSYIDTSRPSLEARNGRTCRRERGWLLGLSIKGIDWLNLDAPRMGMTAVSTPHTHQILPRTCARACPQETSARPATRPTIAWPNSRNELQQCAKNTEGGRRMGRKEGKHVAAKQQSNRPIPYRPAEDEHASSSRSQATEHRRASPMGQLCTSTTDNPYVPELV
ncbi:uncharacterized protein C8Q71DRAFT_723505 [Rhodofomes roseus]|uniref:Uncharacterized protein n=1 Tax=Rhodofomes roseus TaxID=34475 RepID=A0ABQ8KHI7_9APHY|nr:uncharacterized protein C8Q71DRAFT_723505 [Rhodofomes roseus]KAH9837195.1 hypothetical protein C8Q71DRAFT_723505 [Rhodofomes roseus]